MSAARFSLARLMPLGAASADVCLALARALLDLDAAGRSFSAEGIEARIDGRRVRLGTETFCQEL